MLSYITDGYYINFSVTNSGSTGGADGGVPDLSDAQDVKPTIGTVNALSLRPTLVVTEVTDTDGD